jgi:hypothetical protein
MRSLLLAVPLALAVVGCHTEGVRSSTSWSAPTGTNASALGREPIIAMPLSASEATTRPAIYISREVKRPGVYSWSSGMTLTDAVTSAGGLTEFAGRSRIRLYHKGHSLAGVYDYDRILKHKTGDPALEPFDSISVIGSLD